MDAMRRKLALSALLLPAGCAIQPLERLPRAAIPAPHPPHPVRAAALGQTWTYDKFNFYNSERVATEREEVVALSPRIVVQRQSDSGAPLGDEHHTQWGRIVRDPAWDAILNYNNPVDHWPESLQIGAISAVSTRYWLDGGSFRYWINVQTSARAWERVKVPAGTFDALRIEKIIRLQHPDISRLNTVRRDTLWLAPEVGRWVARETNGEYRVSGARGGTGREDHFRWELTRWS